MSAPGDATVTDRRLDRTDWWISVSVGLVSGLVALIYRAVLVPTDPWHYVIAAQQFPSDSWVPAGLTRYGMILPLIPFAKTLGQAQFTYYVTPITATVVLAAVVYLLGARASGRVLGIGGAAALMLLPLMFINLSRGYPDVPGVALLGVAFLCLVLARDSVADRGRPEAWQLLLLGFALGWGFECRETTVFAWPIFAVLLFRLKPVGRTLLLVLLPMIGWALLDMTLSGLFYGNPLLKFEILLGSDINQSTSTADAFYQDQTRGWYTTRLPIAMREYPGGALMLAIMGIAAVVGIWRRKTIGMYALWAWLAAIMLALQGGVLNPEAASVRVDVPRYWIAFLPGAVLAIVAFLGTVRRPPVRVVTAAVAMAAVLWVSLPFPRTQPTFAPNGGTALEEFRTWMAAQPPDPDRVVFTDWTTGRILPSFQLRPIGGDVWQGKIRSLTGQVRPETGDLILIFSADDNTCQFCRINVQQWLEDNEDTLADDEVLWQSEAGNAVLYRATVAAGGRS